MDKNLSENQRNSVTFHFIRKWVVNGWPQNLLENYFSKNLSALSKPFASLIISYISQPSSSSSSSSAVDKSKDLDLLSVFSGEFLMKIIEHFIFEMHSTPSSTTSTSGSGNYNNNQSEVNDSTRDSTSFYRTNSKSQLEVNNNNNNGDNNNKETGGVYGRSIPNNKTYSTVSNLTTTDPKTSRKSIERVSSTNGIISPNGINLNGSTKNENDPISQANALLSHEQKLWIGIKENMEKDISRRHKSIITVSSTPNPPSLGTDEMLSFSCEHTFRRVWFYESILPEFTQRMEQLSIPLTTKLIFAGLFFV